MSAPPYRSGSAVVSAECQAWAQSQTVGNPLAKYLLVTLGDCYAWDQGPGNPTDILSYLIWRCEITEQQALWAFSYLQDRDLVDVEWHTDGTASFAVGQKLPEPAAPRARRRSIPPAVRATVLERDGYMCVVCLTGNDLHIDHIVPVVNGGTNAPDNLQVLCAEHNMRKGTRDNAAFMAEVRS